MKMYKSKIKYIQVVDAINLTQIVIVFEKGMALIKVMLLNGKWQFVDLLSSDYTEYAGAYVVKGDIWTVEAARSRVGPILDIIINHAASGYELRLQDIRMECAKFFSKW